MFGRAGMSGLCGLQGLPKVGRATVTIIPHNPNVPTVPIVRFIMVLPMWLITVDLAGKTDVRGPFGCNAFAEFVDSLDRADYTDIIEVSGSYNFIVRNGEDVW